MERRGHGWKRGIDDSRIKGLHEKANSDKPEEKIRIFCQVHRCFLFRRHSEIIIYAFSFAFSRQSFHDQSLPSEQIEKVRIALEKARISFEAKVYSGAAHGWTMADLPAYNKAAEEKHWNELLVLFNRRLKA
ncbi:MAG: hypothetical protein EOP04_22100 [Proteobacteria bacterium]|nr:MAG: hypothetical protein EOP04_22100 [Pseudomonadota bacterium]